MLLQAGDRKNLTAWSNGDNLVNAVASVHQNTIVVVNSVGQINLEQWIDNPNVTAVSFGSLSVRIGCADEAPLDSVGCLGRFGRV